VNIRVTPTNLQRVEDLTIVAQVNSGPDEKVMGEGQAPAGFVSDADPPGGEHFFFEMPRPDFQAWTDEPCPLSLVRENLTWEGRSQV
jgi:hypothetical protein